MPTRAGRSARAFTARGIFNLRNARFIDDGRPLDENCACLCCARHSRAYLHHLFRAEEILGPMLLTMHNLTYYQSLMVRARLAIQEGEYEAYCAATRAGWEDAKNG
jgi:queuine tRNA-ribosyltransferase